TPRRLRRHWILGAGRRGAQCPPRVSWEGLHGCHGGRRWSARPKQQRFPDGPRLAYWSVFGFVVCALGLVGRFAELLVLVFFVLVVVAAGIVVDRDVRRVGW